MAIPSHQPRRRPGRRPRYVGVLVPCPGVAALAAAATLQSGVGAVATYPSEFQLSWCLGDDCHDTTLSAAHFQLRVGRYYSDNGRPPLREAFFVATLPMPYQTHLLHSCPGMVILAYLLLAEVRLYTHEPSEAAELVARAQAMLQMPEITGPHLLAVQQTWPLKDALTRYESTELRFRSAPDAPMSVDFVIPRCREDLSWLADRSKLEVLPKRTRIFVYEKCGSRDSAIRNLTRRLESNVIVVRTQLPDAADPRTGLDARRDECTAYLAHVVQRYSDQELADMTLFLHGDPSDHTPFGFLSLVLRGVALGTLRDVDFLHLGAPRLVHTANSCQSELFRMAIGRPQQRPLSTYCCSQFAVSKRRILQRPLNDYLRMYSLVDGSVPDMCERIGPAYEKYEGQRLSHCFFFEFMWHVVFGEEEELPLRADDRSLPSVLRLKDSEERVPSIWRSYLGSHVAGRTQFRRQSHVGWLREIRQTVDVGQVQVNYGDYAVA